MMPTVYDFILFILFLWVIIYLFYKYKFTYWKKRGVPFRKPLPIVGNILDLVLSNKPLPTYFADLYKNAEGPYFGFYSSWRPYLLIKDPDLIRRILIKDFNSFPNRIFVSDEKLDPIFCNSLFGIKGHLWKDLRKKLSPVFTSGKIKAMTYLITECGKNLEEYLSTKSGENLEMREVAAKYTTDVITSCAFGLNANSFAEDSDFRYYGKLLFPTSWFSTLKSATYLFAPNFVKVFKFTFINSTAAQYFRKVFMETLERREKSKTKRNNLVDILNEIKNQETSDDQIKFEGDKIVAQAVIFFGAGHDTTSSTIGFTLHELSINPDIQNKLREEIKTVIDTHGGITYEAVQDMKYLHMVVSETLRKYPVTPILHRECIEDYLIPETGLVIEKGTCIMISQMGLHLDSKHFSDPSRYNPERFSDENKHDIPKYVYLPFGDGPRNCIGERFGLLSTKLGIIHVLKKFEVVKNSNTREPIVFSHSGILLAKYGIQLTCKKLNTQ
ncbi:hypothetical protein FQA39_LY07993 [Lamprigera yunnana]|nr:hypothetical protein FQA39_LY07993 [Lamprigera yunnana]